MRYPTKRKMKKLIYLEMIALSALLIVAVVVVSQLRKPAPDWNAPEKGDQNASAAGTANPNSTWNAIADDLNLSAPHYFVFDCNGKNFLANSGQPNQQIYPADITKLFTAYTIIETNILSPHQQFTVSEDVLALVTDRSTVAHLQAGDTLSGRHLMEGMLLGGGNDAAYVLACASGRSFANQPNLDAAAAVQVFMDEMNLLIQEKNMLNTNLVNPDGAHDPNHYTTFQDLAVLGNLCMQYNTVMEPASVAEADIKLHDETIIWKNANELINPQSQYYCSNAVGLMAGQTPEAGNCLFSAYRSGSQYLLIGVFGSPESDSCFRETLQLFNQAFPK